MSHSTCPPIHMPEDPQPFFSDGEVHFSAHLVGWIVSGIFALLATAVSLWLIKKHLEFYTRPSQQRHVIRILLMVPVYAIISWCSYYWWRHALYLQLIRDCYEAVVIASFFYLLLHYLGDTEEEYMEVIRRVEFDHWIWPLGSWKYKPTMAYFLYIQKWMIGQYYVLRPGCTLAAVICEFCHVYCILSWSPRFAHMWLAIVVSISVTLAMYAVLQLYVTLKVPLKPYQPLLKFFCVKAVVFLTFWQASLLGLLGAFGVIKDSKYWSSLEIQDGISSSLSCFEMAIFALLHLRCFTYLTYRPASTDANKRVYPKTSKRRALLHVLNFRDVGQELKLGTKQVAVKLMGKDLEKIEPDHLARAFGRTRAVPTKDSDQSWDDAQRDMSDLKEELQALREEEARRRDSEEQISPMHTETIGDVRATSASNERRWSKWPSPALTAYQSSRSGGSQTPNSATHQYRSTPTYDCEVYDILYDRQRAVNEAYDDHPGATYHERYAPNRWSPPRRALVMPKPISPARFPGIDEAEIVDRSYAEYEAVHQQGRANLSPYTYMYDPIAYVRTSTPTAASAAAAGRTARGLLLPPRFGEAAGAAPSNTKFQFEEY